HSRPRARLPRRKSPRGRFPCKRLRQTGPCARSSPGRRWAERSLFAPRYSSGSLDPETRRSHTRAQAQVAAQLEQVTLDFFLNELVDDLFVPFFLVWSLAVPFRL